MWGYEKINESYYACEKCAAVVSNIAVHNAFHFRIKDETSIYELNLPVRVLNALKRHGVTTVEGMISEVDKEGWTNYGGDLTEYFFDMRGIGFKTATQTVCLLQEVGIADTSGNLVKD